MFWLKRAMHWEQNQKAWAQVMNFASPLALLGSCKTARWRGSSTLDLRFPIPKMLSKVKVAIRSSSSIVAPPEIA
jgi:hypothetical protein